MTNENMTSYDTTLWPSPRPQNFARHLEKKGYLQRSDGKRWTHHSAIQALATYYRNDIKTFLAKHPIELAVQVVSTHGELVRLLPSNIVISYQGTARKSRPHLFRYF